MLLNSLNDSQCKAVTTTEGFVRVIAGAGSGKTRALSHRFAFLVNELGVLPSNILCVTFTHKAALEMRQRIRNLIADGDTAFIGTFHSFCVSVLQEEANAVQYPKNFLVLDNADIDSMLSIIYEERGITLREMTFKNARDMFENRKLFKEPHYYEDMIAMPLDILRKKYTQSTAVEDILFYGYLYQQKKCFGLDYNDLIKFTLYIFERDANIREKWQKRLEYIMIDEFQDIDSLQFKLMEVLANYHKNLFIVGDPDQTIYTWRGANVKYLLDFDKNFAATQSIMMMENYRSSPQILAVANNLISKNKNRIKKDLLPRLQDSEKPIFFHAKCEEEEAQFIASSIKKLKSTGVKPSEIAILYRSHFVTRAIEEIFLKEKLAYTLYSGVQFYNRMEIKDALSYLRLIAYHDDLSFVRIINKPKRNIGERRMHFLQNYAEENHCLLYDALKRTVDNEIFRNTKAHKFLNFIEEYGKHYPEMRVSELLGEVLEQSGYEETLRTEGSGERLDNLAELKKSIFEFEVTCGEETTLTNYLSHIAFFSNADATENKDAVKLMTVHSAKGLEFPYVFLCSMEENVFPAKKTASSEAMEEERRLAFVAVTRAQKMLYISDSEGKNLDGSFRYPSRFVLDIDRDLLTWTNPPDENMIKQAKTDLARKEAYWAPTFDDFLSVGDRVLHSVLGEGTIVNIDTGKAAYVVRFDGLKTERSLRYGMVKQIK